MKKPADRTTVRARRVELKEDLARALTRSIADRDVDQCDIADATSVGPSLVQRWTSKREVVKPGLVDVVQIADASKPLAMDLLSWAAEKIGARVIEAVAVTPVALTSALSSSLKESGESHSTVLTAIADGELNDHELRRIANDAGEAERAQAAIRQAALDELTRRNTRARA